MGSDQPLVARRAELEVVGRVLTGTSQRSGRALLVTGEAGIGKTRFLAEAGSRARDRGLLVLHGRAVESGGAYRVLTEALTRAASPLIGHQNLRTAAVALGRILPGWPTAASAATPLADPNTILADAVIDLLTVAAPDGAVLIMDDLQWADTDTITVLCGIVDAIEDLPISVLAATRDEPRLADRLMPLVRAGSVRQLPLPRLFAADVRSALAQQAATSSRGIPDAELDALVSAIDGLPVVLDEVSRHLSEGSAASLDPLRGGYAAAISGRFDRLPDSTRAVLETMAVVGECGSTVLVDVTGLSSNELAKALRDGLLSGLLVAAPGELGVTWRHGLIRDAVRGTLLSLECRLIAERAVSCPAITTGPRSEGDHLRASDLLQLAGRAESAVHELVEAARAAVRSGALDVAEQYLLAAQNLAGGLPAAAVDVLAERIELLTMAGRAGDGYRSGMLVIDQPGPPAERQVIIATARAAFAAGLVETAKSLAARVDDVSGDDPDLLLLAAQGAFADRRSQAEQLAASAADRAAKTERFDLACEALLLRGRAARRRDWDEAERVFDQARLVAVQRSLPVREVQALVELGTLDVHRLRPCDRLSEARELAVSAGMTGLLGLIDLRIGEGVGMDEGMLAAYVHFRRAEQRASQLQLVGLLAHARAHLATCYVHAADGALPGCTEPPRPEAVDELVADALALGQRSTPVTYVRSVLGVRAWTRGETASAISLIDETYRYVEGEVATAPWWGFGRLLKVVEGADIQHAFGSRTLLGNYANRAAYCYARVVDAIRVGEPADYWIAEAESYTGRARFARHWLRTAVAPAMIIAEPELTEGWLREADAFYAAAGERACRRRLRQVLTAAGRPVPRSRAVGSVPSELSRKGVTGREAEILTMINTGLSNAEIAERLVLSVRTVESHVSSLLRKTGTTSRSGLRRLGQ